MSFVYGGSSSTSTNFIDLDTFKKRLNDTSGRTTNDDELQSYLDAATNIAENYIGGPITPTGYTEQHSVNGSLIVLGHTPVVSIETTLATYPGYDITFGTTDLLVDQPTGIVRHNLRLPFYGDVTISYIAGWSAPPPAMVEGILEIARHLYETTQRAFGGSSGPFGDPDNDVTPTAFALPNRAKEFLEGYRVAPAIA